MKKWKCSFCIKWFIYKITIRFGANSLNVFLKSEKTTFFYKDLSQTQQRHSKRVITWYIIYSRVQNWSRYLWGNEYCSRNYYFLREHVMLYLAITKRLKYGLKRLDWRCQSSYRHHYIRFLSRLAKFGKCWPSLFSAKWRQFIIWRKGFGVDKVLCSCSWVSFCAVRGS